MSQRLAWAILALPIGACTTSPVQRAPPAAPPSQEATTAGATSTAANSADLALAAIQADAARSDHETDSKARADLSADASRQAQSCLQREPQAVACLYGSALADGLEARAHPTHAIDSLNHMLDMLGRAEAADQTYDQAGPARVRALVLARAPGWPLGPGDPDAAVTAARRAVAIRPEYPPNLLALGESLDKTGDAAGSRESYERARTAAEASSPGAERDEWLRTAEQALQRK